MKLGGCESCLSFSTLQQFILPTDFCFNSSHLTCAFKQTNGLSQLASNLTFYKGHFDMSFLLLKLQHCKQILNWCKNWTLLIKYKHFWTSRGTTGKDFFIIILSSILKTTWEGARFIHSATLKSQQTPIIALSTGFRSACRPFLESGQKWALMASHDVRIFRGLRCCVDCPFKIAENFVSKRTP